MNLTRYLKDKPIIVVFVLYVLLSLVLVPRFANGENLVNILVQSADLAIIACGLTFVIMNGGIDFSVVAVINLGSIVGATIMSHDGGLLGSSPFGWIAALAVMLVIGVGIGAVNGLAVVSLRMPSFIATMGTQLVFSGLALVYTQSVTVGNLPRAFVGITDGHLAWVPIPILITILVVAATYYILHHTVFGRSLFALGTSHTVARISGLPVKKVVFRIFLISGFFAAVGGVIMTARVGAGMPALAREMLLDIVAAVIIGGTSIAGGEGSIMGTLIGAVFIIVLNNSLRLLGIEWYVINVCKGVLVLAVAFLDVVRRQVDRTAVKGDRTAASSDREAAEPDREADARRTL
jgi:ribose/xylose/arabinose/galactoside ABC-type transport system permease subunit